MYYIPQPLLTVKNDKVQLVMFLGYLDGKSLKRKNVDCIKKSSLKRFSKQYGEPKELVKDYFVDIPESYFNSNDKFSGGMYGLFEDGTISFIKNSYPIRKRDIDLVVGEEIFKMFVGSDTDSILTDLKDDLKWKEDTLNSSIGFFGGIHPYFIKVYEEDLALMQKIRSAVTVSKEQILKVAFRS
jgi:hypothetical protein